jgi:hypothetical protein
VQQPPLDIGVVQSSASYRLGFNSAVENHGDGPLIVKGRRASTTSPMVADQEVKLSGTTSTQTYQGIGSMQYYVPHDHWHYLGFDRYELRRPSDYGLVAPDQKAGFCLGDRYTPGPGGTRNGDPQPPGPYTDVACAPGNTQALSLTEGISVGFGDEYHPQLEGQYIDITRLRAGRYTLRHHVNPDRRLRESSFENNFASVAIELSRPRERRAAPTVRVLRRCPGRATCRR